MRVLHASSELHPYSKSGGLADMVAALTKSLAAAGHEISVVTPLYHGISPGEKLPLTPLDLPLELPLGPERVSGRVWVHRPRAGLTVYFIDQPFFYDRRTLYTEYGRDYSDNARRFIFFSKAIVHLARHLPSPPDLVHVHDWQAALVPLLIRHENRSGRWPDAPRTCLTIHNLAYQGVFPAHDYAFTNLPPHYFRADGVEFYRQFNCLKAGLLFADRLTTVSPSYAREITRPELGCGLDGVLRQRGNALVGILNGVDYDEWNPERDVFLRHHYSIARLRGKLAVKRDFQRAVRLPMDLHIPLFVTVTRLVEQKGPEILLGALEEMLHAPMQFALLGSGAPAYEEAFRDLALRYPQKVFVRIGFEQGLSHQLEAAGDFFLMPSRFEPCGLNQMYSQRYGTIPIVRATGGLNDSVTDLTDDQEKADGIKFWEHSSAALAKAIQKALVLYDTRALLRRFRCNAMRANFSWDRTRKEYLQLYEELVPAAGQSSKLG